MTSWNVPQRVHSPPQCRFMGGGLQFFLQLFFQRHSSYMRPDAAGTLYSILPQPRLAAMFESTSLREPQSRFPQFVAFPYHSQKLLQRGTCTDGGTDQMACWAGWCWSSTSRAPANSVSISTHASTWFRSDPNVAEASNPIPDLISTIPNRTDTYCNSPVDLSKFVSKYEQTLRFRGFAINQ